MPYNKCEVLIMIKIYGMPTCPYCAYIEKQIEGNPNFQYIDIGSHVHYLHEFLELRDHNPVFTPYKEEGDVGVPCFVLEDGTVTLEPSDVGLVSLSQAGSCRIDGSGC